MKHLLLISFFVLTGSTSLVAQNNSQVQASEKITDSMIFLTYHIKKSEDTVYKIQNKNKILAKGRIKGFHDAKSLNTAGNIRCELLDKELKVIETIFVKNPLKKVVEFVNDSDHLEKRLITLDSTDFAFRMPYNHATIYARIQVISNSNVSHFSIVKL